MQPANNIKAIDEVSEKVKAKGIDSLFSVGFRLKATLSHLLLHFF